MYIKKIEWRNFASYGNKLQTIEFNENNGNFYLVLGQNGVGKSTISDVIKFSLYGKLDNKKLKDIPNRFNNSAWCRIVLQKNKFTEVVIERGISPNILKCFINGKEYEQAGKKNIQQYIEDEIIELPFYVFNNIISLSINDFKSFLSMRPQDKRLVIDKIFNLEIINEIQFYIKNKSRDIKNNIFLFEKEIEMLNHSINASKNELEKLKKQINKKNESKINEIKIKINNYKENLENITKKYNKLLEKEKEIKQKINEINSLINNKKVIIKQFEEKEKLYKNERCPVCGSELNTDEHKKIFKEWKFKKAEAEQEIDKNNKFYIKYQNLYNKFLKSKETLKQQQSHILTSINYLNNELKNLLNNENQTNQTNSLKNIINESIIKKDNIKLKQSNERKKERFFKILEDIFSDNGIKQLAIKRILPSLNTEINKLIKELNLEYRIMFDEKFDAKIKHLGYDVTPQMLSTGERKKLDFAVLLSFIKLMKIKFQGLNIIFLDEIFSSIDSDGIYHILQILSKTSKELNLNIFVINHSPLPIEIFDYQIQITKINGFSNINVEKIQ